MSADGGGALTDLWSLDPQSTVWTEVQIGGNDLNRPQSRQFHGFTGSGSTLYLFGGRADFLNHDGLGDLWAIETSTKIWVQLAAGPTTRQYPCFGSSGGLIYLLGGGVTPRDAPSGSGTTPTISAREDFWSYNPANDSWSERTGSVTVEGSNPWPRHGGALLDVAGKLFLVHGETHTRFDTFGIAPNSSESSLYACGPIRAGFVPGR